MHSYQYDTIRYITRFVIVQHAIQPSLFIVQYNEISHGLLQEFGTCESQH